MLWGQQGHLCAKEPPGGGDAGVWEVLAPKGTFPGKEPLAEDLEEREEFM